MTNKINLIFDLDDTLVQTPEYNFINGKSNNLNMPNIVDIGIINAEGMVTITYLRPYLKDLLKYCYENYTVSFWTSGNYFYCIEVLKIILTSDQYDRTKLILSKYNHSNILECKNNVTFTNDNLEILNCKPMDIIFNNFENLGFKRNNTILIDDNIFVCNYNKQNTINIVKFNRFNYKDTSLLQLLEWLKKGEYNIKLDFKDDGYVNL